jgi:Ion channel
VIRRKRVPRTYGVVLGLVALTYAVNSASGAQGQPFGVLLQVTTAWFALLTAGINRRSRGYFGLALVGVALVAVVAALVSAHVVVLLASALLYVVAPVAVLRHLAIRPVVDNETLMGAVASYAMIGMLYAFIYLLTASLQPGPFFTSVEPTTTAKTLFFSFTTLTTTGYGDLVPARNPGQTIAVSEMLLGQIFLVTVFAKVVSGLAPRAERRGPRPPEPP